MHSVEESFYIVIMKSFVFCLLLCAIILSLMLYSMTSFGHRGELLLFWGVGGFWLWKLRDVLQQTWYLLKDRQENEVLSVTGKIQIEFSVMPGIIPITLYKLQIKDHTFKITRDRYHSLVNQSLYEVFYTKHAHILLNAVSNENCNPQQDILTQRELQVLNLIAVGLTNNEIANELYISINTVKTHVKQIYRKLDVGHRTEAVQRSYELKLLTNHSIG